jgi:hypothetical protein
MTNDHPYLMKDDLDLIQKVLADPEVMGLATTPPPLEDFAVAWARLEGDRPSHMMTR